MDALQLLPTSQTASPVDAREDLFTHDAREHLLIQRATTRRSIGTPFHRLDLDSQ